MAWSPSWAKHAAWCPLPWTFLPSLDCASSATRPAGGQFRNLNWLKCKLPKIYFLLALLHEAAHHGDQWGPELTCGQELQESPSLCLWFVIVCSLWTAGTWSPERWLRVVLSSSVVLLLLLFALPVCPSTPIFAITSPLCSPGILAILHHLLQNDARTGGEEGWEGEMSLELVDFSLRNAGLEVVAGIWIGTLHKGGNLSALANKAVNVKNISERVTPMEVCRAFRASVIHLFWFLVCKAFLKFNNKNATEEPLFVPCKLMYSTNWYYFSIH